MNIKAAIWDLDGTLLNTLDDLAASTNAALAANGLPTHTTDEVRMFVGNGIGKLIERAVPNGRENPKFQAVYDAFVAHYGAHSRDRTKPYDGILPMLDALTAQGVKLAIVSNKIDFAVKALSRDYFGERMQAAIGDDYGHAGFEVHHPRPAAPEHRHPHHQAPRLDAPNIGGAAAVLDHAVRPHTRPVHRGHLPQPHRPNADHVLT